MSKLKKQITLFFLCIFTASWLHAMPETVRPVEGFELDRYLGKWYEVARLDHRFERGMSHVTAEYSVRDDGKVRVLNKGWKTEDQEWKDAEGKARFADEKTSGHLEVSFFWIFYSDYVIFELDKEGYQYAFISGADTDALWFLSRTPTIGDDLKQRFIEQASARGFDINELIWVDQENRPTE